MKTVAVLGAGSWGSALAALLCNNGQDVILWSHRESQVREMKKTGENDKLPGVKLPKNLRFSADLKEAVSNKDLLVMAVPSVAERETAKKIAPFLSTGQKIITVSKGIEETTLYTQTDILEEELPDAVVGVLSGPSHAEEVIMGLPTLVVVGAKDEAFAKEVQVMFANENFRVYTGTDVLGIEIGASLKNVMALAAGMSDGLGYGDNAKAALITRGIKEMSALSVAAGGLPETLSGLTGVGDLIVTCQSQHSRNRRAGYYIGQGMTPQEAYDKVKMVVEGAYSAKAALAMGEKYGVDLPIIREVNRVLFEGKNVKEAVWELMNRSLKSEM
ncbi:MAG: NAD(P)-dependent glycerol-3-phosphate dehydrogenase [Lachnospiraceae bacterium]|nr:NAD(P)-dependent glycerol-3-phosphate dehydrogenase [Lachnospiraceae bacterium]